MRKNPFRGRAVGGPTTTPPPYRLVTDPADLPTVLAALDETTVVALDTETTGLDPRVDHIRLLSLGTDTVDGGTFVYLLDVQALDPVAIAPVLERLADKDLVAHNAVFNLSFLARLGFTPRGKVHDTMLLSQLLVAGTFDRVGLADCCQRWLDRDLDKTEQASRWSGALTEAQLIYAADDVRVLLPLLAKLLAEIEAAKLVEAAELERRCLMAMVWMSGAGVPLDRAAWTTLADAARGAAEQLRQELDAAAPRKPGEMFDDAWNWSSPVQVKQVLALAGCPVEKTDDDRRLYLWVLTLMQDFQKATGKDMSSHDFRKAAFTRAAEEDIHPKRAAVAFDVTAETMLRYYTATEKKRTADEVLGELQGKLMPRKRADDKPQ